MKLRLFTLLLLCCATPVFAAWTERYVDSAADGAGDGTTTATSGANGAWTLAQAANAANTSAGMRINIKKGTYANTTTTITFSDTDATTTGPIWLRGYDTTVGDIDADPTNALTLPSITFTTGQFAVTADCHMISGLNISGASVTSGGQVNCNSSATDCSISNCVITNTAANSLSRALTMAGARCRVTKTWLSSNAAANVVLLSGVSNLAEWCHADGGLSSFAITGAGVTIQHCVSDDAASHAITTSSAATRIINNSIYSPAGDGLDVSAVTAETLVANNIFVNCTGTAVNSSAAATLQIYRYNNAYFGNGAVEAQIDTAEIGAVTLASDPFTNAASDDFTIVSGSLAKGAGFPPKYLNESYSSYLDIGAVQRQEAGGSNTITPINGSIPGL